MLKRISGNNKTSVRICYDRFFEKKIKLVRFVRLTYAKIVAWKNKIKKILKRVGKSCKLE